MEEEILLGMYRKSFDEFLEAYKKKMDQNEALVTLVEDIIKITRNKEAKQVWTDELERIKNI